MAKKRDSKKELLAEKVPFSTALPASLVERARACVYYTPGLTLASLIELALAREINHLEKKHRKTFAGEVIKLSPGRPVKFGPNR